MKNLFDVSRYFLVLLFLFVSCKKAGGPVAPEVPVDPGGGVTKSFTSTQAGSVDYQSFSLVVRSEAVPRLSGGNPGTVIFSINVSATIDSGIPAIPSGYTLIGKYLRAGPEAFVFNSPIQVYFPATNQPSPQDLTVLGYSPETRDWRIVPTSAIDTAGRRIGIDVLKLGYFVLTKRNSLAKSTSDFKQGGCVFDLEELWTNFILTVKSATPEKPEILNFYSGGLIGKTYSGPIFQGCPQGKTKAIVPQGVMEFWVSKTVCQGSDAQVYTYTLPASVTVPDPLNFIGWSTYDAVVYVPFSLPTGGTWVLGRPTGTGAWPQATVPFGSGILQATLTWYNQTGATADLDLHLYGPNGIHVYYANKVTPDFSLDRDWRTALGSAIENVYSLKSVMPSGDYSVRVVHYSGAPMSFNARVILNGSSTNYSGTLTSGQEAIVKSFTIQ